jgi:ferritin
VKKQIQEALNDQIRAELHSAYVYLAMSAHFAESNFDGFAHWMRLQAQEELQHAMKLYDYVLERGGHVDLRGVDAPGSDFGSPLQIFETALKHERMITGMIHDMFRLARQEGDYATEHMLQWFIEEQVEEEDSASRAVDQLRMAADSPPALLMLDQRFGAR